MWRKLIMSGILVVNIIYNSSGEVSGMIFATVNIKKKLQPTPPKYYTRNKQRRWLSQIFYNYGIEFVTVKIQWQGKPDNNIAESNFTLWINDFLTYYLVEDIRRKEGIQLLEIWELFPNTRPRFELPVGLSGLETFSAVDLGKADEVDGSLFTFCTNLSQSVEFLQPSKKKKIKTKYLWLN